jgi:hypothetical protein
MRQVSRLACTDFEERWLEQSVLRQLAGSACSGAGIHQHAGDENYLQALVDGVPGAAWDAIGRRRKQTRNDVGGPTRKWNAADQL